MVFDHRNLELPIHPRDTVYTIDTGKGWSIETTSRSVAGNKCFQVASKIFIYDQFESGCIPPEGVKKE